MTERFSTNLLLSLSFVFTILRELNLVANDIGPSSASKLISVLSNGCSLYQLDLRLNLVSCDVGDASEHFQHNIVEVVEQYIKGSISCVSCGSIRLNESYSGVDPWRIFVMIVNDSNTRR
jgi:catabolite regulation protein CreA